MIRFGFGALAACMIAGSAQAADLSPADIVARHTAAVAKSDVDAMMADYADDAIVLEAGQAIQGKAAIRALLERLFPKQPAGAAPSGMATMKITKRWAEGDVGFFNWENGPAHGTDEFIVHGGKIAVQSVFISRPAGQ